MRVVEATGVGKRYRLGGTVGVGTLRDSISALVSRERDTSSDFWALRDVSFNLDEGDTLGIIGRNGAGKSTLLKVLSRITVPTEGAVRMRGRVASLLEVGTGFHAELTGRENVFLNGAILGMTRREVARRYDEIVEFSGVGTFMDTPVKRFSSGMYLRLAFAVAAYLEPDVLIVDEVLAVGDAEFQAKCLGRMAEVERSGRTIVFVSHDLSAVARLCTRSLWLEGGRVMRDGPTAEVIDAYLTTAQTRREGAFEQPPGSPVVLHAVTTVSDLGSPSDVLPRDRPFAIDVEFSIVEAVASLDLAVFVMTSAGVRILDQLWSDAGATRPTQPGRYRVRLDLPPVLNAGRHLVGVWLGGPFETYLEEDLAAAFDLEGSDHGRPERLVALDVPWSLEVLS